MPLFIAKSNETWIPPYPARQAGFEDEEDGALYPRQYERPLAERVHRGTKDGVWLGGRPPSAADASRAGGKPRGIKNATTTTTTTINKKKMHRRDGDGDRGGGRWYAVIGGKPGENIGGAVVSSWSAAERAMSLVGQKEREEIRALGLPTHRAFSSKEAALNWLAVQGLNARGRSAPSEEVKIMSAKGAWIYDSTPRTAAAESGVAAATRLRQRASLSPFEWPDAPPSEFSRDNVAFRRHANRRDAWAAELARDTRNTDLRLEGSRLVLHQDEAEFLTEVPPWRGGGWEPKGLKQLAEEEAVAERGRSKNSWMPRDLTPRVMRDAHRFIPYHLQPSSTPPPLARGVENDDTKKKKKNVNDIKRNAHASGGRRMSSGGGGGGSRGGPASLTRSPGSTAARTGGGIRSSPAVERSRGGGGGGGEGELSPSAALRVAQRYPTLAAVVASSSETGGGGGATTAERRRETSEDDDDDGDGARHDVDDDDDDGDDDGVSFTFDSLRTPADVGSRQQQYWEEYRGECWDEYNT